MVFPFHSVTKSAEETKALGAQFGTYLLKEAGQDTIAQVICCWGDLGSGKTTFVQGLAYGLGISKRLLSPTFIIVRHYDVLNSDKKLHHFDLYRFQSENDLASIGLSEILVQQKTIVCIEWPERLGSHLPKSRIDVRCSVNADDSHSIEIIKI